jgi:choline kinase
LQFDIDQQAHTSHTAVQIAEPVPEYRSFEEDAQPVKQFRTGHNRRLSGKMPSNSQVGTSSRSSCSANDISPSLKPVYIDDNQQGSGHQHRHHPHTEKLVAQISEWLERQQEKQASRKTRPHHHYRHRHRKHLATTSESNGENAAAEAPTADDSKVRARADSFDSQSSDMSLDKLAKIIEESRAALGLGTGQRRHSFRSHRPRSRGKSLSQRTASSDTDYVDGDVIVPDCDVVLDNSKAMGYSGGGASTPADELVDDTGSKAQREREGWLEFKNEIIRTAHTLRLKGWRRVPLGAGDSIDVERICGALTNAVYSVTPPSDLPKEQGKKQPAKLLLRIYGPQVEHLIDRETELNVLQRLARKKIGPRLLGTFKNGRFEQYFHASTLTAEQVRDPEVSRQIAKRTRELHAGIELLPNERDGGPAVWMNWTKWQDKATAIMSFVDKEFEKAVASGQGRKSGMYAWRNNGYVCGVPYPQFQATVIKYRQRLERFYATQTRGFQPRRPTDDPSQSRLSELHQKIGRLEAEWKKHPLPLQQDGSDDVERLGRQNIMQNLVFAHNDVSYIP